MRRLLPIFLLSLCFYGCAQHVDDQAAIGSFVRGNARVISIDPALGHVELDYNGRTIDAYWQIETQLAQHGEVYQNDFFQGPVAQYHEPIVKTQTIDANPGDTIAFIGMKTGSGILLRSVAVVAKAP